MLDDLLTTAEAATRLGKDVRTIHRWVEAGRLPVAMRLPGATGPMLFRPTDVEALLSPEPQGAAS